MNSRFLLILLPLITAIQPLLMSGKDSIAISFSTNGSSSSSYSPQGTVIARCSTESNRNYSSTGSRPSSSGSRGGGFSSTSASELDTESNQSATNKNNQYLILAKPSAKKSHQAHLSREECAEALRPLIANARQEIAQEKSEELRNEKLSLVAAQQLKLSENKKKETIAQLSASKTGKPEFTDIESLARHYSTPKNAQGTSHSIDSSIANHITNNSHNKAIQELLTRELGASHVATKTVPEKSPRKKTLFDLRYNFQTVAKTSLYAELRQIKLPSRSFVSSPEGVKFVFELFTHAAKALPVIEKTLATASIAGLSWWFNKKQPTHSEPALISKPSNQPLNEKNLSIPELSSQFNSSEKSRRTAFDQALFNLKQEHKIRPHFDNNTPRNFYSRVYLPEEVIGLRLRGIDDPVLTLNQNGHPHLDGSWQTKYYGEKSGFSLVKTIDKPIINHLYQPPSHDLLPLKSAAELNEIVREINQSPYDTVKAILYAYKRAEDQYGTKIEYPVSKEFFNKAYSPAEVSELRKQGVKDNLLTVDQKGVPFLDIYQAGVDEQLPDSSSFETTSHQKKDKKKKKEEDDTDQPIFYSSCGGDMPPDPDDEWRKRNRFNKLPEKEKHPFGRYEDASYHTAKGNSLKSKRPKDGQAALDNSFSFRPESRARVGISEGEFVLLAYTSVGLYHGHVRSWDELDSDMQNVLKSAGKVRPNGKIIK